jgi:serine protease SohB|tara:strand:- start:2765 stop:3778 length:1014 start_codon:yes stop_codon:yes gene_type:complete
MEFLFEYGYFLLKTITIIVLVFIPIFILISSMRHQEDLDETLKTKNLTKRYQSMANSIKTLSLSKDEKKKLKKSLKKEKKASPKSKKKPVYVLNFEGDIDASNVANLKEEINAILQSETKCEEIVLNLESAGGTVIGYGLAAAQLQRIRDAGINLTACVDKIAASGGYMMACVANKIVSAPFAIIGSIGVVAAIPNFHKILKKNDIDYELHTAGEYKRTITAFGETTEEGRKKFKEDLHDIHELFKDHVSKFRPSLDISKVATGEIWEGSKALEVGLIDSISTSDGYLMNLARKHEVFEIKFEKKEKIQDKLSNLIGVLIKDSIRIIEDTFNKNKFK